MRNFLAVCVSIMLMIIFFFSLFHIIDYGIVGLFFTGLSGYCLYKLYMSVYNDNKRSSAGSSHKSNNSNPTGSSSMFMRILFGDATDATGDDPDDWR